jgi:hypothetical protein
LIYKKRFKPDFKKIILRDDIDTLQKLELLNDEYLDDFEKLEKYLNEINLLPPQLRGTEGEQEIIKILEKMTKKVDLYYDALK